MNPAIEALLLQLASLCLRITAQGKWNAHYNLYTHCNSVDVYLLPASTKYTADEVKERAFSQAVYYSVTPGYEWQSDTQRVSSVCTELQAMHKDLEAFLVAEQQEGAA